ncbi:12-(S)-hydroxy-5,8,10,14-eicosatetraenoic acid receptor-like protein [Labeo rohita]|uniref:12-(S)-hydroxy-5,8,10,14-eicosatetraenoic acid receptor-like protein n=1 Tax=Labeo rohita TaxID=84645 RepID=A0A498MP30_LABRO|nr:12-(S)-hydroxy-5,8,10,14-eicosatetraenoic acid receptor-like protein [Labeo rohita]RXN23249.1 12-(S)-hydroxy-5,8,10,14-eicosatetraenoic acid receptor-like protein [Labeo rohita]
MDNTNNGTVENCQVHTDQNRALYIFYSSVVVVEFILGLLLNITVIHLFVFKLKFWKSKTIDIFRFNLVLADILLLIGLPMKAYNFHQCSEQMVVCKVQLFLQFLNRGASIAFLTVIFIYRYFSVVQPVKRKDLRILKLSPQISVFIWVLLGILTIPAMLQSFIRCNSSEKDEELSPIVLLREIVFFTQIFIPFFVLVYCSIRIIRRLKQKSVGDKTKLRKVFLVTSMVLVFAICFLPYAITRAVQLKINGLVMAEEKDTVVKLYDGLVCLSYLNCLLDPILYCLSSSKFKKLYISMYLPFLLENQQPESSEDTADD